MKAILKIKVLLFLVILTTQKSVSLFSDDSFVVYDQKSKGQLDIALNLEALGENTSDSVIVFRNPAQVYAVPRLMMEYAFSPAHTISIEINNYLIGINSVDPSYGLYLLGFNAAYTFTKKLRNVYLTVGPYLSIPAYQSKDHLFQSSYAPDITYGIVGLSLGSRGNFLPPENSLKLLWNAEAVYNATMSSNGLWRPGTIQITGDIVEIGWGLDYIGLLLGVTQTIKLSPVDNKTANENIAASTLLRLGSTFLLGQSAYLKTIDKISLYPLGTIVHVELIFGYSFQTKR